jgi:hypothetical protein
VTRLRCGPLAAWTAAWTLGEVGPDEVVDAVTLDDGQHLVSGIALDLAPLRDVLVMWRREAASVRFVQPVPGDVRGVPGPSEFVAAALEAGEAAYGGSLGIVPEVTEYFPSSAPPSVVWHAYVVDPVPPDYVHLADVQYELTTAIRETASALAAAEVAGAADDVGDALRAARRAGEHLNLPPGFPPPAVALLAQAERMQAVLDLAAEDAPGGAIDGSGMRARDSALRPLATAVRRARLAGYNAGSAVRS